MALWLDQSQPAYLPAATFLTLALYVCLSFAHLYLTWNRWEADHRLALPAHIIDIAAFTALVFLTEGYTSPIFSFFIFLLLSATIRWGWFATASTAATVILLYALAGTAALYMGTGEFELQRVLIRTSYLLVLSVILIWSGMNQDPRRDLPVGVTALEELPTSPHVPLKELAEFARYPLNAPRALVFLWDKDEPWAIVEEHEGHAVERHRLPAETFEEATARILGQLPFLFDTQKRMALASLSRKQREIYGDLDPIRPDLALKFGLTRGLAIPFETGECRGLIVVDRVESLSSDDLITAKRISNQVAAVFQRAAAMRLSEEAVNNRIRLSLARDIHDSSVQLLAGLSFRLEALRGKLPAESEAVAEIRALQMEIASEQKELRKLISTLRGSLSRNASRDMRGGVEELARRLSEQWGVSCRLISVKKPIAGSTGMEHDLHQLIREAVANAVRHGGARHIALSLWTDAESLHLEVKDDGSGFSGQNSEADAGPVKTGPWSLHERTRNLGGSLAVETGAGGTRIMITLPNEGSQ